MHDVPCRLTDIDGRPVCTGKALVETHLGDMAHDDLLLNCFLPDKHDGPCRYRFSLGPTVITVAA